ncbi:MAG: hypothetical protein AB1758_19685 [Candidatus Eremiobacterota bacterium]
MSERPSLVFSDRVRSIEPAGDQVEVTFLRHAAVYRVPSGSHLLAALDRSRSRVAGVQVTVDAATNEILAVQLLAGPG